MQQDQRAGGSGHGSARCASRATRVSLRVPAPIAPRAHTHGSSLTRILAELHPEDRCLLRLVGHAEVVDGIRALPQLIDCLLELAEVDDAIAAAHARGTSTTITTTSTATTKRQYSATSASFLHTHRTLCFLAVTVNHHPILHTQQANTRGTAPQRAATPMSPHPRAASAKTCIYATPEGCMEGCLRKNMHATCRMREPSKRGRPVVRAAWRMCGAHLRSASRSILSISSLSALICSATIDLSASSALRVPVRSLSIRSKMRNALVRTPYFLSSAAPHRSSRLAFGASRLGMAPGLRERGLRDHKDKPAHTRGACRGRL